MSRGPEDDTKLAPPNDGDHASDRAADCAPPGEDNASPRAPDARPSPPRPPLPPHTRAWRLGVRTLRVVLPILVLLGAALGTRWMLQHRKSPKRRKPRSQATLVEVNTIQIGRHQVVVKAMGRVRAEQEVELHPQIKGEVLATSPDLLPGGFVKKGQVLLRIDPRDYELAVNQSRSAVRQAEADLRVEQGRQAVAAKELQLLGAVAKGGDRDLVLRGPQLRKVQANLAAARAALDKARLDLSRTTLRAPFNAVVQSRDVDVGTRVTEANRLAKLVGTDAYWVELVVPVDQLRWLHVPTTASESGSRVRLNDSAAWGPGAFRWGRVARLAPDLEEKGRMARIIVRVDDPLARKASHAGQPRLLIGSYVQAEIHGATLPAVAAVPRRLIRDGNRVWLMDQKRRLEIRRVDIAFRGPDQVLVSRGLRAGDQVVATDLATPVQGMLLKVLRKGAAGSTPASGTAPMTIPGKGMSK